MLEQDADFKSVWNRIAGWWSDQIGEGNAFQRQLIMPVTDRLLAVRAGMRVLDVACGNGNYARRLGRAGAIVTAFDGSENFIADARARTTQADGTIDYHVIDATDERSIAILGPARFDAAVCSMALMDLPTLDPLLAALRTVLRPAGVFVFSVSHPCFNSARPTMTAGLSQSHGKPRQEYGIHVTRYQTPFSEPSVGILHQPEAHTHYHDSLAVLLQSCFDAGFVLNGLEEPSFPAGAKSKNPFSWSRRPEIPPAMVARVLSPTSDPATPLSIGGGLR